MRFVHALFAHRRKNMLNNLELAFGVGRAEVEALFKAVRVDGRRRAEQLTWQELDRLYTAYRAHHESGRFAFDPRRPRR